MIQQGSQLSKGKSLAWEQITQSALCNQHSVSVTCQPGLWITLMDVLINVSHTHANSIFSHAFFFFSSVDVLLLPVLLLRSSVISPSPFLKRGRGARNKMCGAGCNVAWRSKEFSMNIWLRPDHRGYSQPQWITNWTVTHHKELFFFPLMWDTNKGETTLCCNEPAGETGFPWVCWLLRLVF